MRKFVLTICVACVATGSTAFAQIKQTKEQMMYYTSEWKGDRFSDGRPKVPDNLLERALDVSIEDVWDYLRTGPGGHGARVVVPAFGFIPRIAALAIVAAAAVLECLHPLAHTSGKRAGRKKVQPL